MTTWVGPEGITVTEISQMRKTNIVGSHLHVKLKKQKQTTPKLIQKEIRSVVTRGRDWGGAGDWRKVIRWSKGTNFQL